MYYLMFQNLPELEFLDLAYNNINEFDFASFDQVGTLSSFKVNVSHNEIARLWINNTIFVPLAVGELLLYLINMIFRSINFNLDLVIINNEFNF